jgi:hypothetical protein
MPGKRLTFADEHNDILVVVRRQIFFLVCIKFFFFLFQVCNAQPYPILLNSNRMFLLISCIIDAMLRGYPK